MIYKIRVQEFEARILLKTLLYKFAGKNVSRTTENVQHKWTLFIYIIVLYFAIMFKDFVRLSLSKA